MKRIAVITFFALVFGGVTCIYQYFHFNDGKLHVVFCNVGQGDAIFIKTPGNKYILQDAGPDKKVLDCLSSHMPLWNRTIDLAFLTHPHTDHFMGFFFLKDRYEIKMLAREKLTNKTAGFQELLDELNAKHIRKQFVEAGDHWRLGDGIVLTVEAPTQEFLDKTSPNGTIGENKEFASLITDLSYDKFDLVLTGDTQADELAAATSNIGHTITVLQTPHHGSATGLTTDILATLDPKIAVISVGKNNYGHPTLATLQLLTVPGITLKRTDKDGDVEIISDGIHTSLNP